MIVAVFGRNRTRLTGRLAFFPVGLPRFALLEALPFGLPRFALLEALPFGLLEAVCPHDLKVGPSSAAGRALTRCRGGLIHSGSQAVNTCIVPCMFSVEPVLPPPQPDDMVK